MRAVVAQHRMFCGDAPSAAMVDRLRLDAPEKTIVVEADTFEETCAVVDAGADIVQIDKDAADIVAQLRRCCEGRSPRPVIAAAGGINAADYARAGADVAVNPRMPPATAPSSCGRRFSRRPAAWRSSSSRSAGRASA